MITRFLALREILSASTGAMSRGDLSSRTTNLHLEFPRLAFDPCFLRERERLVAGARARAVTHALTRRRRTHTLGRWTRTHARTRDSTPTSAPEQRGTRRFRRLCRAALEASREEESRSHGSLAGVLGAPSRESPAGRCSTPTPALPHYHSRLLATETPRRLEAKHARLGL